MRNYWDNKSIAYIAGVAAVALLVVPLVYFWNFSGILSSSQDVWGQFGDYFGGILNPVLSFCAFIALLYTIHLQVKFSFSVEGQHREKVYEDRLFQLIGLHQSQVDTLRYYDSHKLSEPRLGSSAIGYNWVEFRSACLDRVARGDFDGWEFDRIMGYLHSTEVRKFPPLASYMNMCVFMVEFVIENESKNPSSESPGFALRLLKVQMSVWARLYLFYYLLMSKRACGYIPELFKAGFWDDAQIDGNDPIVYLHERLYEAAMNRND